MDLEKRPAIEPLRPRELGKDGQPSMPWGEELLLVETPLYTMKRLTMRAGASGPLQHHERKDEAFWVASGRVDVTFLDSAGGLQRAQCFAGQGFHIPPGAPHRVSALEDTVMYEVSNPVFDDRVSDEHLLR